MLVIRFSRVGRHNHAQYRIIVQEKTQAPTKKHLEIVGSYDPHSKKTVLQEEKIKEYLANGAQPSDSVYNLLVRNEVITGAKRAVKLPEKKESTDTSADAEGYGETGEEKDGVATEEKVEAVDETVSADAEPKVDKKEIEEEMKEKKAEKKKEEKETEAPAEKEEVKEKSADTKNSDEKKEEKVEKKEKK